MLVTAILLIAVVKSNRFEIIGPWYSKALEFLVFHLFTSVALAAFGGPIGYAFGYLTAQTIGQAQTVQLFEALGETALGFIVCTLWYAIVCFAYVKLARNRSRLIVCALATTKETPASAAAQATLATEL